MLFALGSNGSGQLSLGHAEDTHVPTQCRVPEQFPAVCPKRIVAGGSHTFVLFATGELLATGDNTHGQCGISTNTGTSFHTFRRVPLPEGDSSAGWNLVAAGWEFSILVSSSGAVYCCGQGHKGELGQGNAASVSPPQRLEAFSHASIVSISSGMAHSVAVLSNGEAWGWGAGRKGQLGIPAEATVSRPRLIQSSHGVAEAVCGRECTFLISQNGGEHTVLGPDRYGLKTSTPLQGELQGWVHVGASWNGLYVLLKNGTVKAWGRNDRGQLPPAGLEAVHSLAVGSEHALALVKSEGKVKLYAWGWGEHGNCGRSREEAGGGDVIGELFRIKVDGGDPTGLLGAGCATSWIWAE